MSEHEEQAMVVRWAAANEDRWPELGLLFAIPNGGWRNPGTARALKAEGVRPGIPDLCLPVARGGYHSCWIEMKYRDGKCSPEQRVILDRLHAEGHFTTVCWDWTDATEILEHYLSGEIVRGHEDWTEKTLASTRDAAGPLPATGFAENIRLNSTTAHLPIVTGSASDLQRKRRGSRGKRQSKSCGEP